MRLGRSACRFGAWLASARLAALRTPPELVDIDALYQADYALAEELLRSADGAAISMSRSPFISAASIQATRRMGWSVWWAARFHSIDSR